MFNIKKKKDELNLKVTSIKFVMEKVNSASLKWSSEEYEKKLRKVQADELEKTGQRFFLFCFFLL